MLGPRMQPSSVGMNFTEEEYWAASAEAGMGRLELGKIFIATIRHFGQIVKTSKHTANAEALFVKYLSG